MCVTTDIHRSVLRLLKLVTYFVHVGTTKLYANYFLPAKEGVKISWIPLHCSEPGNTPEKSSLAISAHFPFPPLQLFPTFCSTHCNILLS